MKIELLLIIKHLGQTKKPIYYREKYTQNWLQLGYIIIIIINNNKNTINTKQNKKWGFLAQERSFLVVCAVESKWVSCLKHEEYLSSEDVVFLMI